MGEKNVQPPFDYIEALLERVDHVKDNPPGAVQMWTTTHRDYQ